VQREVGARPGRVAHDVTEHHGVAEEPADVEHLRVVHLAAQPHDRDGGAAIVGQVDAAVAHRREARAAALLGVGQVEVVAAGDGLPVAARGDGIDVPAVVCGQVGPSRQVLVHHAPTEAVDVDVGRQGVVGRVEPVAGPGHTHTVELKLPEATAGRGQAVALHVELSPRAPFGPCRARRGLGGRSSRHGARGPCGGREGHQGGEGEAVTAGIHRATRRQPIFNDTRPQGHSRATRGDVPAALDPTGARG
jgi:hypothetical protein